MTLITYPTRVHFADGVLEEALHSELEHINASRFLLVCHEGDAGDEWMDRIVAGLPSRMSSELIVFNDTTDLRQRAYEISSTHAPPDAIISFASAKAIEFGRKIRFTINQESGTRPPLFGVPSVDGLPDPCLKKLESPTAGMPSVVICDPTVILGTGQRESREAVVMSLIRCIEAYLSVAYNPPADGIALDGLSRCLRSLHQGSGSSDLEMCRNVMAASLNAFLSQEKGVGPAQIMTYSLLAGADSEQKAAIARLVLPGVLSRQVMDGQKANVLRKVLSDADEPLPDATRRILSEVQMPSTLADIGVPRDALDAAARSVDGQSGLSFQNARSVLEEVYTGV